MQERVKIIATGSIIGFIAVLLVYFGNPANMGFFIACFIRDTAGALGLHRAEAVQYIRPEIIGLILGSFLLAAKNKEFSSRGGSAPFTRFILSIVVMIGALIFLGCPLRMILRLAGGDLNALFGLVGLVAGVYIGILFINRGLHCAPSAHKTLGTFPEGTVRFGLSHFLSETDILYTADCINKLK